MGDWLPGDYMPQDTGYIDLPAGYSLDTQPDAPPPIAPSSSGIELPPGYSLETTAPRPTPTQTEKPASLSAPDKLLTEMIRVESGGDAKALGPMTSYGWQAKGLMQLGPDVIKDYGVKDPFDPQQNFTAGKRYYTNLLNRYRDHRLALMAYNWGPGNVDRWMSEGATGPIPQETQGYLEKLLPHTVSAEPAPDVPLEDDQPGALSRGLSAGRRGLQAIGGALVGAIGDIGQDIGLPYAGDVQEWGVEVYEKWSKEAGEVRGDTPSFEEIWQSPDKLDAFLSWAGFNVASGAVTTIPALAASVATANPAPALAVIYGMGVGEAYGAQLDETQTGDANAYLSGALGIPYAAAEKLFGAGARVGSMLRSGGGSAARSFLGRLGVEIPKTMTGEAIAESVQQVIQIAAQAIEGDRDVMDEIKSRKSEILEAGAAGGIAGGPFGVVGAIPKGRQPEAVTEPSEAEPAPPVEPPIPEEGETQIPPSPAPIAPSQEPIPTSRPVETPSDEQFDPDTGISPMPAEDEDVDVKRTEIEEQEAAVNTEPTDAQKEAGNYKKGHIKVGDLDVTIENPRGSKRTGTDQDGTPWEVTMPAAYGYIKRTEGADAEQIDIYVDTERLKTGEEPDNVFIVDQIDPDSTAADRFDEHKVIIGPANIEEAEGLYRAGFSDGRGGERLGGITEMTIEDFRAWLEDGDSTKAFAYRPHESSSEPATEAPVPEAMDTPEMLPSASAAAATRPEPQFRDDKDRALWHLIGRIADGHERAKEALDRGGSITETAKAVADATWGAYTSSTTGLDTVFDVEARAGKITLNQRDGGKQTLTPKQWLPIIERLIRSAYPSEDTDAVDRKTSTLGKRAKEVKAPVETERATHAETTASDKRAKDQKPPTRAKRRGRPAKAPKRPLRLSEALAREGGIKDQAAELKAMGMSGRTTFVPGAGPLVRAGGRSLDYARERAAELGYLPDDSTISDFLELLERDFIAKDVIADPDLDEASFQALESEEEQVALDDAIRNIRDILKIEGSKLSPEEIQAIAEEAIVKDRDIIDVYSDYVEARAIRDVRQIESQPESTADTRPQEEADIGREDGSRQALEQGQPDQGIEPQRTAAVADQRQPTGQAAVDREQVPPSTEETDQGQQYIQPGVEPVTDRDRLEARADKPLQSTKPQKPVDDGLFDVAARSQQDLKFSAARPGEAPMQKISITTSPPGVSPEMRNAIEGVLREIVDQIAPRTAVRAVGQIQAADESGTQTDIPAFYSPLQDLITVSLNFDTPEVAVRHETIHALREYGMFTDLEWSALEARAMSTWMDQYSIARRYPGLSQDELVEEAVAEAFGHFRRGQEVAPGFRRIFERIIEFFQRLANALRSRGFQTPEDIFGRVERGEVGRRERLGRAIESIRSDPRFAAAYHGSPHDFDQFTTDKIGAGEGAQSFGWGLYFAGNRAVAEFYRDKISDWTSTERGTGKLYQVSLAPSEDEYLYWDKPLSEQSDSVKRALGMSRAPLKHRVISRKFEYSALAEHSFLSTTKGKEIYEALVSKARRETDHIELMESGKLKSHDFRRDASLLLAERGIPGIKYLDQGSRKSGDGTYNYVIFDERLVNIEAKLQRPPVKPMSKAEQAQLDAMRSRIGQPKPGLREKYLETFDGRFFDWMRQGMFDDIHAIGVAEKKANKGKLHTDARSAAKMAYLTRGIGDVSLASWLYGAIKWDGGTTNFDESITPPNVIFEKVGKNIEEYELFRTAQRAQELKAASEKHPEGREHLFSDEMISAGLRLGDVHPEFHEYAAQERTWQSSMMDFYEQSGLIAGKTRDLFEQMSANYVPFNRVTEKGKVKGPPSRLGFQGQHPNFYRLTGGDTVYNVIDNKTGRIVKQTPEIGKAKSLANRRPGIYKVVSQPAANIERPFLNLQRNSHRLIEASMKNVVMLRLSALAHSMGDDAFMRRIPRSVRQALVPRAQMIKDLEKQGLVITEKDKVDSNSLAVLWSLGNKPKGDNVVSLVRGGKVEYWEVDDPMLFDALAMISQSIPNWIKPLATFKHILTAAVGLDPAFQTANIMRDTIHASVTSHIGFRPGIDSAKGFVHRLATTKDFKHFLASGAAMSSLFEADRPGVHEALEKKLSGQGVLGKVINTPRGLIGGLERAEAAFEYATRFGVYKRVLANGASRMEAAAAARDVATDFARKGSWPWVRFFAMTVPFLNAGVQGLYRTARGGAEKPFRFFLKASLLAAFSVGLFLMNRDDERFKKLNDFQRDMYWIFYDLPGFGDKALAIPKPFEVGALFGSIPERIAQYAIDNESEEFVDRLTWIVLEQFRLDPIPQAFKPPLRIYSNWDEFRDRPVVPPWLHMSLNPAEQFDERTSYVARALGRQLDVSPMQIDTLVYGYFGNIGNYTLAIADELFSGLGGYPERPAQRWYELPVIRRFVKPAEPYSSKELQKFYELKTETDRLYNSIRKLQSEGEIDRARSLIGQKRRQLAARDAINKLGLQLRKVRNRMRDVSNMPTEIMTGEEKRDELERLRKLRNRLADKTRQIREHIDK